MTDQKQINQLKAQVNCLREALDNLSRMSDCTVTDMKIIARALVATPEQCLAKIKAKAIDDVADKMRNDSNYTYDDDYYISYIYMKADQLLEQAK
jgi:hypothetical protein